jgi:thiol-disulfide isomerase/thioredoxin
MRSAVILWSVLFVACPKRNELNADLTACLRSLPRGTAQNIPVVPTQYVGKVVLVTFVATWCFPCIADLVTLKKLERDFGSVGFENVLVGVDLEGRQVLEPFAAGYSISAPLIIADDSVRRGETPFGLIKELPTRVLFDRKGQAQIGFTGVADYRELEAQVKRLIEAPP